MLGLPSELVAALPDPIEHPAHRSPLPPEIVISALSIERCRRCPARSRPVHANDGRSTPTIITLDRHEHRLTPNAYDWRLGEQIRMCGGTLDAAAVTRYDEETIPGSADHGQHQHAAGHHRTRPASRITGGSVELLHDLYAGPPAPLPGQAFILAPKRDRGRAVPGPVLLTVAESAPTGRRSGGTWPP